MSSSQATSPADEPGEASPQHPDNATISEKSLGAALSESQPGEATLLGIPKELRNKIFGYVYATPDVTGERVSITVIDPCVSAHLVANAFIPLSQAPPPKDPILVCRQLYSEMGKMQAQAFRQYWNNTTFGAYVDYFFVHITGQSYVVTDSDLKHASRFVVPVRCRDIEATVECNFQDGRWTALFNTTENLLKTLCGNNGPLLGLPMPQGRQCLVEFDKQMRTSSGNLFSPETRNIDPTSGSGFDVQDVYNATRFVEYAIIDGPYHGWEPV